MRLLELILSHRVVRDSLPTMKTTVEIPDALYSQASKLAKARGEQVSNLIAEGLKNLLAVQLPLIPPQTGKNGTDRPTALSSTSARWLAEWRALGEPKTAAKSQGPSAADIISRMRR